MLTWTVFVVGTGRRCKTLAKLTNLTRVWTLHIVTGVIGTSVGQFVADTSVLTDACTSTVLLLAFALDTNFTSRTLDFGTWIGLAYTIPTDLTGLAVDACTRSDTRSITAATVLTRFAADASAWVVLARGAEAQFVTRAQVLLCVTSGRIALSTQTNFVAITVDIDTTFLAVDTLTSHTASRCAGALDAHTGVIDTFAFRTNSCVTTRLCTTWILFTGWILRVAGITDLVGGAGVGRTGVLDTGSIFTELALLAGKSSARLNAFAIRWTTEGALLAGGC